MTVGMIFFFFAQLSGVLAISLKTARTSILLATLAGFLSGAGFLSLGAEYLAITQWLVSGISALGLLFFEMMFGNEMPWSKRTKQFDLILALLAAVSICGVFLFAVLGGLTFDGLSLRVDQSLTAASMGDLGIVMTRKFFIVLQIVGFLLLVAIVGSGVLARPSDRGRAGSEEGSGKNG